MARPLCLCGCGKRVNRVKVAGRFCRWASQACIPRDQRVIWARAARASAAYKMRRVRFAKEIAQLKGCVLTQEDLLVVFTRIERHGYNSGYAAGLARRWKQTKQSA